MTNVNARVPTPHIIHLSCLLCPCNQAVPPESDEIKLYVEMIGKVSPAVLVDTMLHFSRLQHSVPDRVAKDPENIALNDRDVATSGDRIPTRQESVVHQQPVRTKATVTQPGAGRLDAIIQLPWNRGGSGSDYKVERSESRSFGESSDSAFSTSSPGYRSASSSGTGGTSSGYSSGGTSSGYSSSGTSSSFNSLATTQPHDEYGEGLSRTDTQSSTSSRSSSSTSQRNYHRKPKNKKDETSRTFESVAKLSFMFHLPTDPRNHALVSLLNGIKVTPDGHAQQANIKSVRAKLGDELIHWNLESSYTTNTNQVSTYSTHDSL